ncbi:MAG TPA: antitoxin family protein [Anaerolineae bacterium]|nr:antitoxin family protein [Anaerolineae bacterium]
MVKTIEAVFDGQVLRPEDPLTLEPNTRVRITIETVQPEAEKATSFLRVARSLNLDGPSDWAVNLETHLYGGESHPDG